VRRGAQNEMPLIYGYLLLINIFRGGDQKFRPLMATISLFPGVKQYPGNMRKN